jgi:hypothetical protein
MVKLEKHLLKVMLTIAKHILSLPGIKVNRIREATPEP